MPRTKLFYNYFKEYDNWFIYIFHTFQSGLNSVKKVINKSLFTLNTRFKECEKNLTTNISSFMCL